MKDFFTKERLRAIISFILAFFICLGVFTVALTAGALYFTKESALVKCIEKTDYTTLAVADITDELNELAIPSGLADDFFNGKINAKDFDKLFYTSLKNTLAKNNSFVLNIDDFKAEIINMVTDHTKSEVDIITSETEKDIAAFSDACGNVYLSYINPSLLSYVLNLLGSVGKYAVWVNVVALCFAAVCGFILFRLNNVKGMLKYLFASFMGAALTLGVIPGYLLISNEISKIGITSKSLFAIVTGLGNGFLTILVVAAGILAAVSVIFLLVKIYDLIFKK